MTTIEQAIQQPVFKDVFQKALVNLIYTHNVVTNGQESLFKNKYGLTTPQYNVLRILRGQHPKPCTINLLIERMLDKSSNASRIVDKLESKGLVIRVQCKNDRRAVDVLISTYGLELLGKIDVDMENWYSTIRNITDEEATQLNYLLDKLRG